MGCTQSKIENEETVTRCKDRKQYMKDAVSARNAFAAAHSSYAISLKNTGAALSDYAHGEVQFSSSASSAAAAASSSLTGGPQPPYDSVLPPPPPLPEYTSSPLQRATSMPEISMAKPDMKYSDPILEEDEDEIEAESAHGLRHHRSSKSSGGGGGSRTGIPRQKVEEEPLPPPPSPPRTPPQSDHPPPPPLSTGMASWDFFFPSMENVPGPTLAGVDEDQAEREEIERKMREESSKRSEVDGGVGRKSGKIGADVVLERAGELPPQPQPQPKPQLQPQPQPPPPAAPKVVKRVKQVAGESLLQIFSKLDDCFLKASESAREVSKMLEANRLHYHSNFADNRGHIDHSARVMRVITWNRSFRGLPNADDGKDDFDSEENETHATVLDKMLAWEKKLYDEVKAGEQMKLEYQRKVASLNKLKKHISSTESLERTKAAVSHLHTRYIVDMQSMDSTVSEINRLRDAQLYPKLIVLVDGMATMWEKMEEQHKNQSDIVEALRSLDISNSAKETTEHHHERTVQLSSVVQEWRSQFEKLIFNQKSYVKSLNNWLKLNLIPIDNNLKEKVSSPQRPQNPPIQTLLHAWHDHLEKLPEEPARRAISNFEALISTIIHYQADEMKLRDKCEETRKEVLKRGRQFEDWHHKYMQKRTPVDEMDPERAGDKDLVMERQAAVEVLKQRLEEEEDAYRRQCVQVREKSVASLKTCLPELFRVLAVFAQNCSETYGRLRYISEPQHVSNE